MNYILKEAYIAIPFSIKPSNITNIMGQNFKFKKGVLFQVSHYKTTFDELFQSCNVNDHKNISDNK